MATTTKTYDYTGEIVIVGIERDVTPNKNSKGFNVRVAGKYITQHVGTHMLNTREVIGKFFNTLSEAKAYADSCIGTVEKVYTDSATGSASGELERKATGKMRLEATGVHSEEHINNVNETRKAYVTASATARASALASAMGGSTI